MVLQFDDDIYTADEAGARLVATQAEKAKTTVQVASMDGSNTAWTRLNAPGLLLVSRGKTFRISGTGLDDLILACQRNVEFAVGHGGQCGCSRS